MWFDTEKSIILTKFCMGASLGGDYLSVAKKWRKQLANGPKR
jgi:hypothetical protein